MLTQEIVNGSRKVIISHYSINRIEARLYVDNGNVATLKSWKGKTTKGAIRWAKNVLNVIS